MAYLHITRSKASRPNLSNFDEGDVEPDDVAPGAATHPVSVPPSSHEIVRSQVEAVGGLESMSTELAEPVPVPATPSPEETPLPGGGPGTPGSVSPLQAGLPLGCPGSQTDPVTLITGQMDVMPDVEYRSDRLQSRPPHAARAAAAAGVATGKVAEVDLTTPQSPARPLPLHATTAAAEDLSVVVVTNVH